MKTKTLGFSKATIFHSLRFCSCGSVVPKFEWFSFQTYRLFICECGLSLKLYCSKVLRRVI